MRQTSTLTRALTDAQETHAKAHRASPRRPTTFRLYTERFSNLPDIIAVWFDSATLYNTTGMYEGAVEKGSVIEIVAPLSARARIISLARNIRRENEQQVVLVTWQDSEGLHVFNVKD